MEETMVDTKVTYTLEHDESFLLSKMFCTRVSRDGRAVFCP